LPSMAHPSCAATPADDPTKGTENDPLTSLGASFVRAVALRLGEQVRATHNALGLLCRGPGHYGAYGLRSLRIALAMVDARVPERRVGRESRRSNRSRWAHVLVGPQVCKMGGLDIRSAWLERFLRRTYVSTLQRGTCPTLPRRNVTGDRCRRL
jgi:hypothetical protein